MKYNKYIHLALLATLLVACGDDDDFQAGPDVSADNMAVYFTDDYDDMYLYAEDEAAPEDTVWLGVKRLKSDMAADVPIQVDSKDEAITIPSSVHFDAGADSTSLPVTFPGLELGKNARFSISIASDYCNPYKEVDGSTSLESSVLWSSWQVVVDSVIFQSSYENFPTQGCKIENLKGAGNRFRFTDFLGSGNPLEFSITTEGAFDSTDLTNNKGRLNPLAHYWEGYNSNYATKYWVWSNDGDYSAWTPTGGSKEITQIDFYPYYYDDTDIVNLTCQRTDANIVKLKGQPYYCDENSYGVQMVYLWGIGSWDYIYYFCYYKAPSDNTGGE